MLAQQIMNIGQIIGPGKQRRMLLVRPIMLSGEIIKLGQIMLPENEEENHTDQDNHEC
jgi:hypothetical protein